METRDAVPQLVILGSSAGGIDALSSVIETIPATFGAPLLIAQHIDPRRPSHLAEILGRRSALPVHGVEDHTLLEKGHAYILPADGGMDVQLGELRSTGDEATRPTPSIDRILSSASGVYGEGLIAVILSGSGSDGAAGARHVKAAGGTVVIQNPDTAAFPSMPEAISPSIVDIVADAVAIGPLLEELLAAPKPVRRGDEDRAMRSFLAELRERTGLDFGAYKRGTINRRLQRRILATGAEDLRGYRKYLEQHPDEYGRLTSSFLIKVTEFFRDSDLFDHLRSVVVPKIVEAAREADREVRIWSAGCSTGEEAYSLAMLLAEELGDELPTSSVRIFATDVDPDAINFARKGIYAPSVVASVPDDLREKYFTSVGDQFEVRKSIRGMTVFGQHDLGQRAPFPRVDLALCRNVLIYFTPELQRRALHLFAFALRDGGYLVLGKSESTTPLAEHFVLENPRLKVYRREGDRVLVPPPRVRATPEMPRFKLPIARRPGWSKVDAQADEPIKAVTLTERAEQILLRLPVGIVVVDRKYDVQLINVTARDLLDVRGQAIDEDLVHLLDDHISPTVKRLLDRAFRGKAAEPVVVEQASITAQGADIRFVELSAQPFTGPTERATVDWVVLSATDVTASRRQADDLRTTASRDTLELDKAIEQASALAAANDEFRHVNRELALANAELRTANEELLVANEEVQAATEEVETLNEELQATNEELETMNEELQATVEELNTTNEDLEARTVELQETAITVEQQRAAADEERNRLLAIIDLIDEPVLVVDHEGGIVKANAPFAKQIGNPTDVELRDVKAGATRDARELLVRASTEAFGGTVRIGSKTFRIATQPLDGQDHAMGAVIFRGGPERSRRAAGIEP